MNDSSVDKAEDEKTKKREFLGDMLGTAEIVGDIVSPVIDLDDFEVYRES